MSLYIRFLINALILIIDPAFLLIYRWSIPRWTLRSVLISASPSFVTILLQLLTCYVIDLTLSTILLLIKDLVGLVELAGVFNLDATFLSGLISV